jgi:hypothetical protein
MRSRMELTQHLLEYAYRSFRNNVLGLDVDTALFTPAGGYRSALGTIKHAAAWSHVYHSFAFDLKPRGWNELDWPRGLRESVDTSQDYVDDIIGWFGESHTRWMRSLSALADEQLDSPHPLHWDQTAPLHDIVVMIASHHVYHAGEVNQLLAIYRGEAWEEGEEVEENHISTVGHRVRPAWRQ